MVRGSDIVLTIYVIATKQLLHKFLGPNLGIHMGRMYVHAFILRVSVTYVFPLEKNNT